MNNQISKERMKAYVEANPHLISVKKQAPNTTVLKYQRKVFYKNLWTPELCELRGTVVDDDFNIVQRPFTKIFNFDEDKAPKFEDDEYVTAVEKINGFMAAATIRDDDLFISTTGSIASDFADMARKHIEKLNWEVMDPDLTYIFEICDKDDEHVIPEQFGAWLLGARRKKWDVEQHTVPEDVLDMVAETMGAMRPTVYRWTFAELKENARAANHEGFVAWSDDGLREIKFKSPYYLATKFLGRKTPERLEKLLADTENAKKILDEEYYVVLDYMVEQKDTFIGMSEFQRMAFLREFFNRKVLGDY